LRRAIAADGRAVVARNPGIAGVVDVPALMSDGRVTGNELDQAIQRSRGLALGLESALVGDARERRGLARVLSAARHPDLLSVLLGLRVETLLRRPPASSLRALVRLVNVLDFSEGAGLEVHASEREVRVVNAPATLMGPEALPHDRRARRARNRLARWIRGADSLRSVSQGVLHLAIPTHDAPKQLAATLAHYTQNLVAFGHREVQIRVFDDSRQKRLAEQNRRVVEEATWQARRAGLVHAIELIDADKKHDHARRIAARMVACGAVHDLDAAERSVRLAFRPSAGGNRNFILGFYCGHKVIVADHDSLPFAFVEAAALDRSGSRYSDPRTIFGHAWVPAEGGDAQAVVCIPVDFVAGIERLLGKRVADLGAYGVHCRDVHPLSREVQAPHRAATRRRDSRKIRMVRPVTTGDHDAPSLYNVALEEPGILASLFLFGKDKVRAMSARQLQEVLRGGLPYRCVMTGPVQQAVVTDGGRSDATTLLGLDLSELVTPGFPTSLRLDDFSLLLVRRLAIQGELLAISSVPAGHARCMEGRARSRIEQQIENEIQKESPYLELVAAVRRRTRAAEATQDQAAVDRVLAELGRHYRRMAPGRAIDFGVTLQHMHLLAAVVARAGELAEELRGQEKALVLEYFLRNVRERFGLDLRGHDGRMDAHVHGATRRFVERSEPFVSAELDAAAETLLAWGAILAAFRWVRDEECVPAVPSEPVPQPCA
jgi:hypothetical protein